MAETGDDKKDVGGDFPDVSHPTTTPTTNHPLDDVDPSSVSSSEPSPQALTPRPHLFSSLEEAYSQITSRSRSGSRQVSGETRNSESGDESFLMSLSPTDARALYTNIGFPITHAFGRSLTETVPSQLPHSRGVQQLEHGDHNGTQALTSQLSSRTEPVIRPSPIRQYIEARNFAEADTSNQPPPYTANNTVGRIIHQHGSSAVATSAAQSQAGVFECSDESDYFIRQYDGGIDSNVGTYRVTENEPSPPPSFNTTMTTGWGASGVHGVQAPPRSATEPSRNWEARRPNIDGHNRTGATGNQTAPDMPLPKDPPFHPTNPFVTAVANRTIAEHALGVNTSPSSHASDSPKPLLHYSDSEDDQARIGSDVGVESEAENRLSTLQPPPERMHSARRHERGRRSFTPTVQASVSGTTTGESENDDPFKYDDLFPQPSKEREVSVYLHQVSGIEQDDGDIHYSPLKTPFRGTGQYFSGEAASPVGQRLLNNAWSANMTPVQNFEHNARAQQYGSGHGFFDSNAINPEWALGSPDAVRVPVSQRNLCDQEMSLEYHPGDQEAAQQLVLQGLHHDEGHNRRMTGNTED
ncbi:hypothetical protein VMCG_03551 [Cytospora schulzeri]|uniref:Uncharacterized protein n=1 Tax=Cytospora schulzeri TaxID=448051 RepID=A0A423WWB5_9PEZI|nr:hypothetical protein VMCG_03551 [Valsa malicola]